MSALDLRSIAHALGGEVQGRQVLAPGPGHSRRDRSLSVRLSPQSPLGFIVFSHASDPFDLCRDHVTVKLGLPLDAWRTRSRGQGEDRPAPAYTVPECGRTADDAARTARALAIWGEAREPAGTLVERYLAGRGLALPEAGAEVLRFHPRCPWGDKALGRTVFVPAMVAAMRSVVDDGFRAVHRTRLTDDGQKVDRKMLGPSGGTAIKLDLNGAVSAGLTVGEGLETCLAARQMGFGPVWACGSTGNIAKLPALAGVECLTILGEAGEASERAVEECAGRWLGAGREVVVVRPLVGSDMNDALRAVA